LGDTGGLAGSHADNPPSPPAITPSPGSVSGYPKARAEALPPKARAEVLPPQAKAEALPPPSSVLGSRELPATPTLPPKAARAPSELGNGIRSTGPGDKRRGKERPSRWKMNI